MGFLFKDDNFSKIVFNAGDMVTVVTPASNLEALSLEIYCPTINS